MLANQVANRGKARQRSPDPLQIELSVRVRFGGGPSAQVSLLEEYPLPMVGVVFAQRDRILSGFLAPMLRAVAMQTRPWTTRSSVARAASVARRPKT